MKTVYVLIYTQPAGRFPYTTSIHSTLSGHPNIATLYDARETTSAWALVQEYGCSGDLFNAIEADRGMPEARACAYALQIATAIEHMHLRGFVHRDIKPENVCLTASDTCRLIDFGHAAPVRMCKPQDLVGTVCVVHPAPQKCMCMHVRLRSDVENMARPRLMLRARAKRQPAVLIAHSYRP